MAKRSTKATLQRRDAKRRQRELKKRGAATKNPSTQIPGLLAAPAESMQLHPDKLSTRVIALTAGLIGKAVDCQEREKLTQLAILAWNASLTEDPESELKRLLTKFISPGKDFPTELMPFLMSMVNAKQEWYPDDKRIVMNHEVTCRGDNFRLTVSGAMPAPDASRM